MNLKDRIEVKEIPAVGNGPKRYHLQLSIHLQRMAVAEAYVDEQKEELCKDMVHICLRNQSPNRD